MKNLRKNLVFIFFLLAGIILGSLIASLSQSIPLLSWLAYQQSVGIPVYNPFILDLIAFRFSIGAEVSVSVAQIFTILAAMLAFNGVGKKL